MATTTETRTNGSNGNGTPQARDDAAKATVVGLHLVACRVAVDEVDGERDDDEPEQQHVGAPRLALARGDDGGLRGITPGLRRAVTVGTIQTSLKCSGHGLLPGHFDVHLLADDPGLTMEKQKRQDEQEQDSLE